MRFIPTSILLLTVGGALVGAFQHSASDGDGLYLHSYDDAGNEIKQLIDASNPIIPPAFANNKTAPAKRSARTTGIANLKTRNNGNGPYCNGIGSSPNDIYWATHNLGQACDNLGWWYHAISYQFQGAIAYACDYGNGNHCDSNSLMDHKNIVDIACQSDREGWFAIGDWAYADGRTNSGTGFC